MTRAFKTVLSRYWGILAILLLWQMGVTISGVNSIVLPQPIDVVRDIVSHPTIYLPNKVQSLLLAALGLLLGMALGTLIAILAWWSSIAGGILTPLALILSSVPVVALVPVIARISGYDVRTVIVIVIVISFFPAFVFTTAGLSLCRPAARIFFMFSGRDAGSASSSSCRLRSQTG